MPKSAGSVCQAIPDWTRSFDSRVFWPFSGSFRVSVVPGWLGRLEQTDAKTAEELPENARIFFSTNRSDVAGRNIRETVRSLQAGHKYMSIQRILITIQLLAVGTLTAQTPHWAVLGDTSGAPPGCSAAAAIRAIDDWFAAFDAADSGKLARTMSQQAPWVFTTGRFVATEAFVHVDRFPSLLAYVRERTRHHERMTLEAVRFYGWIHGGGRELGFMPYYSRAADDLGPKPLAGAGKAAYLCGEGIVVMNLAPRPPFDPGFDR